MKKSYYNENDPQAAEWLKQLIKEGLIAPGDVDNRSIEDVIPTDLLGYTQCHFFAGIGVWSAALRRAGWPDSKPVWTGSCPCQPFSGAGKGDGFADERHLWPAFFHLISQCHPDTAFGEQVASKDGLAWLDLVQSDLEATGYTVGAVDTCAAGFGAPHPRQRLYWVADSCGIRFNTGWNRHNSENDRGKPDSSCKNVGMANPKRRRQKEGQLDHSGIVGCNPGRQDTAYNSTAATEHGILGGMADTECERVERYSWNGNGAQGWTFKTRPGSESSPLGIELPGPLNGYWRNSDWLLCRDGKWRPVESGTFPLANGAAERVVRLRGYGNAINLYQAEGFVRAYLETKR